VKLSEKYPEPVERPPEPGPRPSDPTAPGAGDWYTRSERWNDYIKQVRRHHVALACDAILEKDEGEWTSAERIAYMLGVSWLDGTLAGTMGQLFGIGT
jgi:hypothetical protein